MHIGIIGCGKISQRHIDAYKKLDHIKLTVSDTNVDIAEKTADRHNINFVKNPEELLKNSNIDAIDVCVPTPYHKDIVLKSLQNDKHIFCEKPLCRTLEEAIDIKKAVEKKKKIVMVGYLYRFFPAFQLVKKVLEGNIIGKPYYSIFRVGGRGGHRIWKHTKGQGGGATYEMLVHMLDLALWFFGNLKNPKNLYTDTIVRKRMVEGKKINVSAEDFTFLSLESESNIKIFCQADLITPSYMSYVEIHGDNGSIFASILDYLPSIVFCKEARGIYNRGSNFHRFSKVNVFEKELQYFLNAIKNHTNDMNSVQDSIKVLQVIEAIKNE